MRGGRGIVLLGVLVLQAVHARAAEPSPEVRPKELKTVLEGLSNLVVDPLPPVMELALEYEWTPTTWGKTGDTQAFRLKPTIPFKLWNIRNIARLTLPYDTVTLNGTHGLDETQLFDLLVFGPHAFEMGIGPVVNFEPPAKTGATFQAGPAIGLRIRQGSWTYGFLSRTFLNAEVANSWFQPVLAYSFTDWLALSLGDLQITYDWKARQFDQIPLGMRLDLTPTVQGQGLNFYVDPLYNFNQLAGQFQWRVFFGFAFLVR